MTAATAVRPGTALALAETRARAALADLPDTCGAVASFLAERGHAGLRGTSRACPMAVYLADALAGLTPRPQVTVGLHNAHLYDGETGVVALPLPPAAGAFVAMFDLGRYPVLDVEAGATTS